MTQRRWGSGQGTQQESVAFVFKSKRCRVHKPWYTYIWRQQVLLKRRKPLTQRRNVKSEEGGFLVCHLVEFLFYLKSSPKTKFKSWRMPQHLSKSNSVINFTFTAMNHTKTRQAVYTSWRFKSFEMPRRVEWWFPTFRRSIGPSLSASNSAAKGQSSRTANPKHEGKVGKLITSRQGVTPRRTFDLQQYRCENHKSRKSWLCLKFPLQKKARNLIFF